MKRGYLNWEVPSGYYAKLFSEVILVLLTWIFKQTNLFGIEMFPLQPRKEESFSAVSYKLSI